MGVLPGQEHPPHRGAGHRRARQAQLGTVGDDAAKAALQKQIDDWNKTAARYRSEPETGEGSEELAKRAKQAEHQRDEATAKYHHYEIASAAFQIGIDDSVRHQQHRRSRTVFSSTAKRMTSGQKHAATKSAVVILRA